MKIVLDTDVVVASFRSPTGASSALLELAARGKCRLAISVALMLEYEAVLLRKDHRMAAKATRREAENFLMALAYLAEPVKINYQWRPQTRDPDDDMVLETAINAAAEAIVTFNQRDFGASTARFGIVTMLPAQALEKLR